LVAVPNTKSAKEAKYIYSFSDMKKRYELLKAIMAGKELSFEELNKKYEPQYEQTSNYYLYRKIRGTLVNKFPMYVSHK
jgi:hypothetical protein